MCKFMRLALTSSGSRLLWWFWALFWPTISSWVWDVLIISEVRVVFMLQLQSLSTFKDLSRGVNAWERCKHYLESLREEEMKDRGKEATENILWYWDETGRGGVFVDLEVKQAKGKDRETWGAAGLCGGAIDIGSKRGVNWGPEVGI